MRLPVGRRQPRLRRTRLGLHRFLAAGLTAAAGAVALHALAPAPAASVPVLVAERDVPAGHRLVADDLRVARWAPGTGPDGMQRTAAGVLGRTTAGPLPRGAAVTLSDVLGPGILTGQPDGLLAVPVRLADPATAALARRGDRVDVVEAATAQAVVTQAVVLADPSAPGADDGAASGRFSAGASGDSGAADSGVPGTGGALLVLGVTLEDAERLARAQSAGALSIAVQPR